MSRTNTITRLELAKQVRTAHGVTNGAAQQIVDTVLNAIQDALGAGQRVELRGFATITVRLNKPRTGRNPRTGVVAHVPANYRVRFKAGKDLAAKMRALAAAGDVVEESEK